MQSWCRKNHPQSFSWLLYRTLQSKWCYFAAQRAWWCLTIPSIESICYRCHLFLVHRPIPMQSWRRRTIRNHSCDCFIDLHSPSNSTICCFFVDTLSLFSACLHTRSVACFLRNFLCSAALTAHLSLRSLCHFLRWAALTARLSSCSLSVFVFC